VGAGGAILQPGEVFAEDFRIVRTTDKRGAAASYVALQLSTGKERTLRLMRPELIADEGRRARFEQEARIGSGIKNEHVIDLVGAGIDSATGTPWLASEVLPGEDVGSLVKREGALPPPTALEILEQLCDAVGAAHAAGIVHGDLKPENVLLAESAGASTKYQVKVLDFGIARLVAEPEQAPRGGVIEPEPDVRSIGRIAFHLITGKSFEPGAAESGGPPGFDAWLARSTDRDADARFRNVRTQIEALRLLLATATSGPASPQEPAAPSPAERAAKGPATATPAAPSSGQNSRTILIAALAIAALLALPTAFVLRWKPKVATPASTEVLAAASVAITPGDTTPVDSARGSDASQPAPQADASGDDGASATAATLPGFAHGEMRNLNIAECTAGPKLTEDEVRTIVNHNSDGLKQTCWDKSPVPRLTISETVHVVICGTGAVQSVSASSNDSIGKCIENSVKGWRFPGGGTLDIPFRFTRDFVPAGPVGPGPFDRGAAYGALGSVDLQSCKKGDSGPGHVKITFAPSGQVTNAVVDAPPFAGTAVGNCVSAKLRGAHIPPFLGPPVTLGKSFTIN